MRDNWIDNSRFHAAKCAEKNIEKNGKKLLTTALERDKIKHVAEISDANRNKKV